MSTLLVIMAHAGANDAVVRNWPWYERSGCDILGIGRIGSVWPASPRLIGHRNEGADCYLEGTSQLTQFLDVLEFLLSREDQSPYTDFCISEYDVVFFKPLPLHPEVGSLVAQLAGNGSPPFYGRHYYHRPWWMSRPMAWNILHYGKRMLRANITEQGFGDRWLGLMADLYQIPVRDIGGYSRNTLDTPLYMAQARAAVKAGAICVHGVKTEDQLRQLTEGL